MSLQDPAIAAGLRAALLVTGRDVVYHRNDTALPFKAIPGEYVSQAVDGGGTIIEEVQLDDWLFPLSSLSTLEPAEPGRKDWIDVAGKRYDLVEVQSQGCWGYVDPAKTWARVHTKMIGTVPPPVTP